MENCYVLGTSVTNWILEEIRGAAGLAASRFSLVRDLDVENLLPASEPVTSANSGSQTSTGPREGVQRI